VFSIIFSGCYPQWMCRINYKSPLGTLLRNALPGNGRHPSKSTSHGFQPINKGDVPRDIGSTKGGLNSKLHAVCDGHGRPVLLHLTAGQVSDYKGTRRLLEDLPAAKHILADRGYDADWFRDGLLVKGIVPCIPPKKNRKTPNTLRRNLV